MISPTIMNIDGWLCMGYFTENTGIPDFSRTSSGSQFASATVSPAGQAQAVARNDNGSLLSQGAVTGNSFLITPIQGVIMLVRISNSPAEGNPPEQPSPEKSAPHRHGDGLLSVRSAAILGASFLIAVIAGTLAYFMLGKFPIDLAGGVLAAGTAFPGTVRLLMMIIT